MCIKYLKKILLFVIILTGVTGCFNSEEDEVENTVRVFIESMQNGGNEFMDLSSTSMKGWFKHSLLSERVHAKREVIETANLNTLKIVKVEGAEAECRLLGKKHGQEKWFNLLLIKPEDKWLVSKYVEDLILR